MPCTHSMYYGQFQPPPTIVTIPDDPLQQRLRGRAQWLRERGRIKDAELTEDAAAALDREELARKALAADGVPERVTSPSGNSNADVGMGSAEGGKA